MRKLSIFIAVVLAVFSAKANESYLKVTPNMSPEASKYAIAALDYTQFTALETTANGRLWASVLCGGDSPEGFLTLSYSDSQGKSWVEHNLVLDARAEKLSVRNGAYILFLYDETSVSDIDHTKIVQTSEKLR